MKNKLEIISETPALKIDNEGEVIAIIGKFTNGENKGKYFTRLLSTVTNETFMDQHFFFRKKEDAFIKFGEWLD